MFTNLNWSIMSFYLLELNCHEYFTDLSWCIIFAFLNWTIMGSFTYLNWTVSLLSIPSILSCSKASVNALPLFSNDRKSQHLPDVNKAPTFNSSILLYPATRHSNTQTLSTAFILIQSTERYYKGVSNPCLK